ncbi:probable E3 ubiquitin-protein ligase RNF144A-A [Medicago truncatula]|uniref:RBR-type E3 ubiquitin transferase n=1 Tax=Medicago truncatula TaxID=3880 RepID=A0A072UW99_MEDTR|nr:probable E3 ubiquitin-protein ligase RNF144A-A [Medicago truncatula]KEH30145.1 C6HC-type zinc finger RING/U-box protein [Medicago truncatula]
MEGTSSSPTTDNETLLDDFDSLALHAEEIFPLFDEEYADEIQLPAVHANVDTETNLKPVESKPAAEMFENQNCSHSFCEGCVGSYLAAKIQENIAMVKCPYPNCNGILEPHNCSTLIPKDVFERWGKALCENMVLDSQKLYCPFNDCSAMLVNDEEEVVTVSECPHCNRLFCAQCKVSWHSGVDCREFQSLEDGERGRKDLMAMELAKNKRWKRCPKCSFYVEKIEGCTRISCRCGNQFCYGCGSTWNTDSHYKCATG